MDSIYPVKPHSQGEGGMSGGLREKGGDVLIKALRDRKCESMCVCVCVCVCGEGNVYPVKTTEIETTR